MVESSFSPEHPRVRAVDGLRFLAAFGVVLAHYTARENDAWIKPVSKVFPQLHNITIYGSLGVYLFFIISGFVIVMSAWERTPRQFIASRVGRLYPAYWLAVLLTAALIFFDRAAPIGQAWKSIGISGVLVNLTMTQGAWGVPNVDGVYWTLFVELKFYLLIGVILIWGLTRRRILVLCALWPLLAILAANSHQGLLVDLLAPGYAPFFAMGMLIYAIYRDGPSFAPIALLAGNWAFAMHDAATTMPKWLDRLSGGHTSSTVIMAVITMCVVLLLIATLTPVATLSWRWLTLLGSLTYPLYLFHQRIGLWLISLRPLELSPYVTLAVVVVVMCGFAYLVHRFVERPLGPRLRRAVERSLAVIDRSAR